MKLKNKKVFIFTFFIIGLLVIINKKSFTTTENDQITLLDEHNKGYKKSLENHTEDALLQEIVSETENHSYMCSLDKISSGKDSCSIPTQEALLDNIEKEVNKDTNKTSTLNNPTTSSASPSPYNKIQMVAMNDRPVMIEGSIIADVEPTLETVQKIFTKTSQQSTSTKTTQSHKKSTSFTNKQTNNQSTTTKNQSTHTTSSTRSNRTQNISHKPSTTTDILSPEPELEETKTTPQSVPKRFTKALGKNTVKHGYTPYPFEIAISIPGIPGLPLYVMNLNGTGNSGSNDTHGHGGGSGGSGGATGGPATSSGNDNQDNEDEDLNDPNWGEDCSGPKSLKDSSQLGGNLGFSLPSQDPYHDAKRMQPPGPEDDENHSLRDFSKEEDRRRPRPGGPHIPAQDLLNRYQNSDKHYHHEDKPHGGEEHHHHSYTSKYNSNDDNSDIDDLPKPLKDPNEKDPWDNDTQSGKNKDHTHGQPQQPDSKDHTKDHKEPDQGNDKGPVENPPHNDSEKHTPEEPDDADDPDSEDSFEDLGSSGGDHHSDDDGEHGPNDDDFEHLGPDDNDSEKHTPEEPDDADGPDSGDDFEDLGSLGDDHHSDDDGEHGPNDDDFEHLGPDDNDSEKHTPEEPDDADGPDSEDSFEVLDQFDGHHSDDDGEHGPNDDDFEHLDPDNNDSEKHTPEEPDDADGPDSEDSFEVLDQFDGHHSDDDSDDGFEPLDHDHGENAHVSWGDGYGPSVMALTGWNSDDDSDNETKESPMEQPGGGTPQGPDHQDNTQDPGNQDPDDGPDDTKNPGDQDPGDGPDDGPNDTQDPDDGPDSNPQEDPNMNPQHPNNNGQNGPGDESVIPQPKLLRALGAPAPTSTLTKKVIITSATKTVQQTIFVPTPQPKPELDMISYRNSLQSLKYVTHALTQSSQQAMRTLALSANASYPDSTKRFRVFGSASGKKPLPDKNQPYAVAVGITANPISEFHCGIAYTYTHHSTKDFNTLSAGDLHIGTAKGKLKTHQASVLLGWNIGKPGITGFIEYAYGQGDAQLTRTYSYAQDTIKSSGKTRTHLDGGTARLGYTIQVSEKTSITPYGEFAAVHARWNAFTEHKGPLPAYISRTKEFVKEKRLGVEGRWKVTKQCEIQTWGALIESKKKNGNGIDAKVVASTQEDNISVNKYKKKQSMGEVGASINVQASKNFGFSVNASIRTKPNSTTALSSQHVGTSVWYTF